jgi:putative addiction module component (TIGR02574 family)
MSITELRKLPRDEKLRIVEILWGDLAADESSYVSPPWHEEELNKTASEYAEGRVEVLNWEEAKKELRKRFE